MATLTQGDSNRLATLEEIHTGLADKVAALADKIAASKERLEEKLDARMDELKRMLTQHLQGQAVVAETNAVQFPVRTSAAACCIPRPHASVKEVEARPRCHNSAGVLDDKATGNSSFAKASPILLHGISLVEDDVRDTNSPSSDKGEEMDDNVRLSLNIETHDDKLQAQAVDYEHHLGVLGDQFHGKATEYVQDFDTLGDKFQDHVADFKHGYHEDRQEDTYQRTQWFLQGRNHAPWHKSVDGFKEDIRDVASQFVVASGHALGSFHVEEDTHQWTEWFLRGRDQQGGLTLDWDGLTMEFARWADLNGIRILPVQGPFFDAWRLQGDEHDVAGRAPKEGTEPPDSHLEDKLGLKGVGNVTPPDGSEGDNGAEPTGSAPTFY